MLKSPIEYVAEIVHYCDRNVSQNKFIYMKAKTRGINIGINIGIK